MSHPIAPQPLNITLLASDPAIEVLWAQRLKAAAGSWFDLQVRLASDQKTPNDYGQIIFVDSMMRGLETVLEGLDRRGRAVFLLASEISGAGASVDPNSGGLTSDVVSRLASLVSEGKADDVLLFPFRPLELLGRFRYYHQILMWDEVRRLNTSFSELVGSLRTDVDLAARLQKSHSPIRFPDVKGFKATSRYLAGLRSGGDYFDLAENRTGSQLSAILSDSSSYGLSSAVLSVLMRVAMKLSFDETRSCEETVQRIREEILATLNERDRLSLFYGVISRKDYVMRYLNLGSSSAYYAPPGKDFQILPAQGEAITRKMLSGPARGTGTEISLEPEGRLALISDGFVESVGGPESALAILQEYRKHEPADFVNELVFRAKSKLTEEADMPAQDCTAVVLDVDARVLRQV
jgi:hypothetical protein